MVKIKDRREWICPFSSVFFTLLFTFLVIKEVFRVVMMCMAPISYFDVRKGMRGKFNVIVTLIIHFVLSLGIA